MSPYSIFYNGVTWRTAEHLFQALRFTNGAIRTAIRDEKSPMGAKFLAKKMSDQMVIEQRGSRDLGNMRIVLSAKIDQHPELMGKLLLTGDKQIIEDVTNRKSLGNHDFWGMRLIDGKWQGENALGTIWMKIRENLRTLYPLKMPRSTFCQSDNDGDCVHKYCPQLRDKKPGRHCPLDVCPGEDSHE
jgi:ribA/ribD-fused uncharacterized protein